MFDKLIPILVAVVCSFVLGTVVGAESKSEPQQITVVKAPEVCQEVELRAAEMHIPLRNGMKEANAAIIASTLENAPALGAAEGNMRLAFEEWEDKWAIFQRTVEACSRGSAG